MFGYGRPINSTLNRLDSEARHGNNCNYRTAILSQLSQVETTGTIQPYSKDLISMSNDEFIVLAPT